MTQHSSFAAGAKFNEAQLEAAIIELLGKEGYPHVLGETIDRELSDVLLKEDLRDFLSTRYQHDLSLIHI